MIFLKIVVTFLCILIGVAYMTLVERKLLSYMQSRKGPNKVGYGGILQPLADALKLFVKELVIPSRGNSNLFILLPVLSWALSLFTWGLLPSHWAISNIKLGMLIFLCLMAMNVYMVMGAGWASNSSYAFLGSMRASAQSISYEICLVFLLLFPCLLQQSSSLMTFLTSFPSSSLMVFGFLCWFVVCLAETNRAPFDFAEGESELVSGFNIEYGASPFALLFLGEYTSILFLSVVSGICFLSPKFPLLLVCYGWVMALLFLFVRGVYPRHRYDKLMMICWTSILPLSMGFLTMSPFGHWL